MANITVEVSEEVRAELDELGPMVDMKKGPIVREALERFMPILRERAEERRQVRQTAGLTEPAAV